MTYYKYRYVIIETHKKQIIDYVFYSSNLESIKKKLKWLLNYEVQENKQKILSAFDYHIFSIRDNKTNEIIFESDLVNEKLKENYKMIDEL